MAHQRNPKPPYENGFYMVVVGDDDGVAEPVRIEDGFWYSTGCADPHSLSSIRVVEKLDTATTSNAELAEQRANAEFRQRDYDGWAKAYKKKYGVSPSHRRWT